MEELEELFIFDIDRLPNLHQKQDLRDYLSDHHLSESVIKQIAEFELKFHDNDMPEVLCCLKTHLDPETVTNIKAVVLPSRLIEWKRKLFALLAPIKTFLKNVCEAMSLTCKKLCRCLVPPDFIPVTTSIFIHNMDLFKDLLLVLRLHFILGGIGLIWAKPTIFQNVVSMTQ